MPAPSRSGRALVAGALAAGLVALGGCGVHDDGQDGTQGADAGHGRTQAPSPSGPVETAAPTTEPPPVPTPAPAPSAVDHGPALESATWGQNEGGRSLAVVPSAWVRTSQDPAAIDQLWAELIEAEPEADTTGMHDQLVCHAIGAPDKDSWNLEPWRPDVGLVAVMRARCNPR